MKYKSILLVATTLALLGCSSNKSPTPASYNPDPYESFNRKVFSLNTTLDKNVLRPTTVWYVEYIPEPVRYGAGNFFNNLRDFVSLANDILQLNGMSSMQNLMRVSLNTVVGMAGLIDVSSSLGLPRQPSSFGKTLQVYGWEDSSYLVLPIFGPSTIRDGIGLVPDIYFNPTWYVIDNNYISVGLYVINALDTRAKYLGTDKVIEMSSLDLYSTYRDAYLQSVGQSTVMSNNNSESNDVSIDQLIGS